MRAASSSTFKAYIQLCRPLNAGMAAIGTLIGYALADLPFSFSTLFTSNLLFVLLAIIFIISGGQAINDFFDRDVDAKQKKTRPIPSGKISPKNAFLFASALFVLGNIFALFVNSPTQLTFPIAIFFSFLLIIYSAFMQRFKFLGNIVVALGVGFTYIFGASALAITPLVLAVSLAPFFANWAREIIKDVEDKEMDRGNKLTLPLITKSGNVHLIVGIILLATIGVSYFPTLWFGAGIAYFIPATIANAIIVIAGKQLIEGNAKHASSMMKKGMLIALLAQLSLILL